MKKPLVSVVVPTYNNSNYISKCVESILNQTFKDFELNVVDDSSEDNTLEILKRFKDKRLNILKTQRNSGPSLARNLGIDKSKGKYIFFIDGDCVASKNWINHGLKVFKNKRCLGVEGKIYYVSKHYNPTASDDFINNLKGKQYMSGNIAYSKDILNKVKKFNTTLKSMEDRELAFKIIKFGDIIFCPKMIVSHQKFKLNFKKKINSAKETAKSKVILFKEYNDKLNIYFRIYNPLNLFALLIPPLVLGALFTQRYKNLQDIKTILWIYPSIFAERITLWKNSIKQKILLI